jgi:5'-nucleotidase/UDP-sugar diphosphatase
MVYVKVSLKVYMKRSLAVVFGLLLVLVTTSLAHGRQSDLRILYMNDFHGYAEPHQPVGSTEMLGGIAYLAGRADILRREKPSLLLAAGDMIQGNPWASVFQGKSVIDLMNAMRFDAMTAGNHEFDLGPELAKKRFSEARFPILGANVEGCPLVKPYVIKELAGVKVAIIGAVTQDTLAVTHPRSVTILRFLPPQPVIEKYVKELRKKADLIVLLSHLGHPLDRSLAEQITGLDIIIGGHSHTKILKPVTIGNTIIVQAWEHAKALGVLDLTLEGGRIVKFEGQLEEIRPSPGQEDKKVQAIVANYSRRLNAILSLGLGETGVDWDGSRVRSQETNLGDLIADIMRDASGAQVAILNGGSIKASLRKGKIYVKDLYAVLPFDNYLVALRLTGRQLKDALENGVSGSEAQTGRFPQVSGLSFTYRRFAPGGSRIQEIIIGGQPLVLDKEYVVATTDFLAAGGDGYASFAGAAHTAGDYSKRGGTRRSKDAGAREAGKGLRDLVMDYLKVHQSLAPVAPDRIKELD